MSLECPRCDAPMLAVEYENVEVDYCEDHGVWLDAGELELLLELSGAEKGQVKIEPIDASEEKLRCAYCGEPMEKIRIADVDEVIDRCPNGHGLWFDRGELRHVLEKTAEGSTPLVRFFSELFCVDPRIEEEG